VFGKIDPTLDTVRAAVAERLERMQWDKVDLLQVRSSSLVVAALVKPIFNFSCLFLVPLAKLLRSRVFDGTGASATAPRRRADHHSRPL